MRHTMKLKEDPFERMKNGTKTIEFRLYDEKRRKIKVGDEIEFFKLPKLHQWRFERWYPCGADACRRRRATSGEAIRL